MTTSAKFPRTIGERVRDGSRLAALRNTGLIDQPAPEAFGRLVRMASRLLGVPVSLVSLVGEDRQVFAAAHGLDEPLATDGETPLSHSFCVHVVERDAALVVEDARLDPLVADSLAVRDLGVVAYAGVPLTLAGGDTLGAFCAVDTEPRRWTAEDIQLLEDLAAMASAAIEMRSALTESGLRDALTKLPSRALFTELTRLALAEGEGKTALLALGLDGFRLVNDALGHDGGDQVLRAVAKRLESEIGPGDAVCRAGGDEFVVLRREVADEADAYRLAQRLRDVLSATPCVVAGAEVPIAASVSVVVGDGREHAEDLVAAALAGLGDAPDPRPLDPARRLLARGRLRVQGALAGAHERGEMRLDYQPILELGSSRLEGFEALLRWEHPELGVVSPCEFVPVAERSGAIVDIGEWALARALRDLAGWRAEGARHLRVAVNLAPVQLRLPSFSETVAGALAGAGVPPSALTLEITERVLLDDRPANRRALEDLRAQGIELALDDFGTGYSALGYLTRFPLDVLKIDRSFVADANPHADAVAAAIVAMARGLGMRTVAEGIETPAQRERMRAHGCDLAQGYLFSRPVHAREVPALVAGLTAR